MVVVAQLLPNQSLGGYAEDAAEYPLTCSQPISGPSVSAGSRAVLNDKIKHHSIRKYRYFGGGVFPLFFALLVETHPRISARPT